MSDQILGSAVDGADAPIGHVTAIVFDPTTDDVTHIVVEPDDLPGSERLVPLAAIARQDTRITLAMARHDVFDLPVFATAMFLPDQSVSTDPTARRWALDDPPYGRVIQAEEHWHRRDDHGPGRHGASDGRRVVRPARLERHRPRRHRYRSGLLFDGPALARRRRA